MDAKLKALKVPELKAILTKSGQPAPAKATKADLIARILASQPAQDMYLAIHHTPLSTPPLPSSSTNDPADPSILSDAPLPDPPASLDVSPAESSQAATPSPAPASSSETADADLEKRRQRAARFGIPLVENKPPASSKSTPKTKVASDPEEKLHARAARFGLQTSQPQPQPTTRKRAAPPQEQLDPEELERRRKRAERFGLTGV